MNDKIQELKRKGKWKFTLRKILDSISFILMSYVFYLFVFIKHDIILSILMAIIVFILSLPFLFRLSTRIWEIIICMSASNYIPDKKSWFNKQLYKLCSKINKTKMYPSKARIEELKEIAKNEKEFGKFDDDNDILLNIGRPVPKCDCGQCYWCLEEQSAKKMANNNMFIDEQDDETHMR
jgi:hypothetical protein